MQTELAEVTVEQTGHDGHENSLSAAISACENAAKWEEAVQLLHKMTEKGIGPDVICYSSVISACEKGGQADVALSLLAEMKAEGIRSDVTSYNSAIAACGEGGANYADIALSLLTEMKEEGIQPNVISYTSTISACEKGGDKYTDTALSLFNKMQEAGLKPDGVTYSAITKACFNSKHYSEALLKTREAADLDIKMKKNRPLRIGVSTENGLPTWELHALPEAIACMLLSEALLNLVASNAGPTLYFQDITINTGKGQVLRERVPAFLSDIAGLDITAIEGNEGRFLIRASSLEKWVESGAYDTFRYLLITSSNS